MASDRFVYIIERKLHGGLKIRILFSCVKTIFCHSKINFISSHRHLISSIYADNIPSWLTVKLQCIPSSTVFRSWQVSSLFQTESMIHMQQTQI